MLNAELATGLMDRLKTLQELIESPIVRRMMPTMPLCLDILMNSQLKSASVVQTSIHLNAQGTLADGAGFEHRTYLVAGTLTVRRNSLKNITLKGLMGSELLFDTVLTSASDIAGFSKVVLQEDAEVTLNHSLRADSVIIEAGARLILGANAQLHCSQLSLQGAIEAPSQYRWQDLNWDKFTPLTSPWQLFLAHNGCHLKEQSDGLRIQNPPTINKQFYEKFLDFDRRNKGHHKP